MECVGNQSARYSASLEVLERATGNLCIPLHVAACRGDPAPIAPPDSSQASVKFCGKWICYAESERVVHCDLAKRSANALDDDGWPAWADIPEAGSVIESGRPIATVMAEGASADAVEALLSARAAKLHQLLETEPSSP